MRCFVCYTTTLITSNTTFYYLRDQGESAHTLCSAVHALLEAGVRPGKDCDSGTCK